MIGKIKMKKFLIAILVLFAFNSLNAAYIANQPHQITQPSGKIISCFVSGDEFFNWIHDAEGYSIIQGQKDAWYYYAINVDDKIVASTYRVGEVNPKTIESLAPWTKISEKEYKKRRDAFFAPTKNKSAKVNANGVINNIVIYIRFAGEPEISTFRSSYDNVMNNPSGNSLKSYYTEVSYGNLTINSTHYPACSAPTTTNASYEDSHPRGYFQPYNETNNPDGYTNDRTEREQQLLADAITWVNANSPVPASLNIDNDNDGNVDNVCFMIKGSSGEWAELLWAHRWMLFDQNAYINGKRVYDFTFQPENQVSWSTLSHEMFHALGAPDLYHYNNQGVLTPVGNWDIMESGSGHMGAYMKWKYANHNWINSIPEITANGQYWIRPLTSNTKNCYKIASPNSATEFFIVEFRKKTTGTYENNVPGSGLLIYRINANYDGNADGPPDEVYIYRPFGSQNNDGIIGSVLFGQGFNRTSMNNYTNPASLLTAGSNGGLDIYNISAVGDSMSFWVNVTAPAQYQVALVSSNTSWGSVSGGGNFAPNSSITVHATPAAGFRFVKWSEIPSYRSSDANYAFNVNHNTTLTAMFAPLDSACDGGSQSGSTLVATTTWKISSNLGVGNFLSFYATQGVTYTWSLCTSDGATANFDSEISLFKFDNDSLIAYNDDGCGSYGNSKLVWTAPFTGKVKLRVTEFLCRSNSLGCKVAYKSNTTAASCNINVAVTPPECAATFIGDGNYNVGEQVVIRTYAVPGYYFLGWFENNVRVGISYVYLFTAEANRDLIATFSTSNGIEVNPLETIAVYYNSTLDAITIDGELPEPETMTIYDITGRKLLSQRISSQNIPHLVSTSHLANGIYIVEQTNSKQRHTSKIKIVKN